MKKLLWILLSLSLFACKAQLTAGKWVNQSTKDTAIVTGSTIISPYKPPTIVTKPSGGNSQSSGTVSKSVTVGDGKTGFTLDGSKYPAGTNFIVTAGTYQSGITIENLTGITVRGYGVVLDGINKTNAGFGNTLNFSNLNNVIIRGFTTQNNGYHEAYFTGKFSNLTLDSIQFLNCSQGPYFDISQKPITWDGTDNTVAFMNLKITSSVFDNAGVFYLPGLINGKVLNLDKNTLISNCIFRNSDGGNQIQSGASDHFNVNNCIFTNLNATFNGDTRIISITGNADIYNNSCTNYAGHFAAINPVSFGSALETSHFYTNFCVNSRRYSAFEFQEFAANNVSGVSKSNLEVTTNIAGNLNTDNWTGYPGTFIDNYQGMASGTLGGHVTKLDSNTGYNWFPTPKSGIYWNLAAPDENSGNTYTTK